MRGTLEPSPESEGQNDRFSRSQLGSSSSRCQILFPFLPKEANRFSVKLWCSLAFSLGGSAPDERNREATWTAKGWKTCAYEVELEWPFSPF